MPLVLDASALVLAAVSHEDAGQALLERIADEVCHAPHLIDAELGHVLRRLVLQGAFDPDRAALVLESAPLLVDVRHDQTGPLAEAAWGLRGRVSFYDGLYVALAAALDLPLVTADRRLAGAGGLPCRVEVVGS